MFNVSSNDSLIAQDPKIEPIINIPYIKFTCYLLYVIIFILGLCGNGVVCYVVFRNKVMYTVTNIFIVNLALSDIFLSIFATFFTPIYIFMQKWILGVTLCHIIPYAQGVSVYISSFTLTTIAVDRFIALVYPYVPRLSLMCSLLIILLIWVLAALLTLPYGIFMVLKTSKSGNYYCIESWPSDHIKNTVVSITTTFQFLIPFLVIAFCYSRIFIKLRERARNKPGTVSEQRMREEEMRIKRINKMLISMVVIFGLSWLPINICNIVADFYPSSKHFVDMHSLFIFTHMLAMSSACYNPILYAWLNENFKEEFRSLIHSFKRAMACHRIEAENIEELAMAELQIEESQPGCSRYQEPNEFAEIDIPVTNEIITSVKFHAESGTVSMKKERVYEKEGKYVTDV